MSDRVDGFLDEFEMALEACRRRSESTRILERAIRQARQLASTLESLASSGLVAASVTSKALEALCSELSGLETSPDLEPLIANAKALLVVVEDGIIDGDADRLRRTLARAGELTHVPRQKRGAYGRPLSPPVRVRCTTCDDVVVGRRQGAANWSNVVGVLRNHEHDRHGGYGAELRDSLARSRRRLDQGEDDVEAGRYQLVHF